jgi:hypothetical protein
MMRATNSTIIISIPNSIPLSPTTYDIFSDPADPEAIVPPHWFPFRTRPKAHDYHQYLKLHNHASQKRSKYFQATFEILRK